MWQALCWYFTSLGGGMSIPILQMRKTKGRSRSHSLQVVSRMVPRVV